MCPAQPGRHGLPSPLMAADARAWGERTGETQIWRSRLNMVRWGTRRASPTCRRSPWPSRQVASHGAWVAPRRRCPSWAAPSWSASWDACAPIAGEVLVTTNEPENLGFSRRGPVGGQGPPRAGHPRGARCARRHAHRAGQRRLRLPCRVRLRHGVRESRALLGAVRDPSGGRKPRRGGAAHRVRLRAVPRGVSALDVPGGGAGGPCPAGRRACTACSSACARATSRLPRSTVWCRRVCRVREHQHARGAGQGRVHRPRGRAGPAAAGAARAGRPAVPGHFSGR